MISSMVEHPTGNQRVRGSIRGSASRWSLTNQESLTDELYTAKLYQMVGMPRNWNIGAISCFDYKKMVLLLFSILPRVNWLTLSDMFSSEKGFIKKSVVWRWGGGGARSRTTGHACGKRLLTVLILHLVSAHSTLWLFMDKVKLYLFDVFSTLKSSKILKKKVVSLTNVIIPSQPSWVFEDPYTE